MTFCRFSSKKRCAIVAAYSTRHGSVRLGLIVRAVCGVESHGHQDDAHDNVDFACIQAPEESERLLDEYYEECSKLKDLNDALCDTNEDVRATLRKSSAMAAQQQQNKITLLENQHAEEMARLKDEHQRTLKAKLADVLRTADDVRQSSAKAGREQEDKLTQIQRKHAEHIARLKDEQKQTLERALRKSRSDATTAGQQLRMQLANFREQVQEQAKRARAFASQRNMAEERSKQLQAEHRVHIKELMEHKRALQSELATHKKIVRRLVSGTGSRRKRSVETRADAPSRTHLAQMPEMAPPIDLDRRLRVLDTISVGSSMSSAVGSTVGSSPDRDTIATSTRTSVAGDQDDEHEDGEVGSPVRRLQPIPSPEPIFVTPPRFKRALSPMQQHTAGEAPAWTSLRSSRVRHPEQVSPNQTLQLLRSHASLKNEAPATTTTNDITTQLSNSYEFMKKMLRSSHESFTLLQNSF